jgi:tetratricopeptide (TPR) repeat protein
MTSQPDGISGDTYLRLAWVDFNLGNFDTCLEELEQVIQRVPENDKNHRLALNCKVFLCLKLGKIEEASGAMETYFKLADTAQAGV